MAWHARISASAMKRVRNCAGSVALIEALPAHLRRGGGPAARQGTAAHGLGEYCLLNGMQSSRPMLGGIICLDEHEDAKVVAPSRAGDKTADLLAATIAQQEAKWTFPIDDDMCDAVDVYLRIAKEITDSLPGCDVLVEKSFNLDWLRPDLGGTSDLTIWEFMGKLYVIDYKHGQGVAVDVDDNDQMLTYALGMAKEVDWLFDELILIIVQPRCPHAEGSVRRWPTTKERLLRFQDEVAEAYDRSHEAGATLVLAKDGKIPEDWAKEYLKAGDHCTFCDRNGPLCPAVREQVKRIARADFEDVVEDDNMLAGMLKVDLGAVEADPEAYGRMIGEVLDWVPAIDKFIKAAKAIGFQHAAAGHGVPGHKLVEGRSVRKHIVPEETVVERLTEAGFEKERIYAEPKVKSPAQLDKLGKKAKEIVNGVPNPKFGEGDEPEWLVEPISAKAKGGVSLVPNANPKPAITLDPNADFSDIEEEDDA